jgi:hypothetical protein
VSDLSQALVDAAAEAIAARNQKAWTHSDSVQYRLEGQDVVVAALETLADSLAESERHHDDLGNVRGEELRRLAAEVRGVGEKGTEA